MNNAIKRFATVMVVGSSLEIFGVAYGLFNRSWAGLVFMIVGWSYKLANGILFEIRLNERRTQKQKRMEELIA